MNNLARVFAFKITATVVVWCAPLILMPRSLFEAAGVTGADAIVFARLLGWAYLSLCFGYAYGFARALEGKRALGPIVMGIVSNGGACAYLAWFGISGAWSGWSGVVRFVLWASIAATLLITAGLYAFGVKGRGEIV